jgi:glutamyl-tRNA synthetase
MEISHIIRGEEWISSTPKHILLYDFFGWEKPVYAHMPLLRNPDKSKLSKRKNPVWVSWYREQGFIPEAIRNYLATLAWAHPEGKEIFDLNEMIRIFSLEQIQTTAPIFDTEKLRWMNGEYVRKSQKSKVKSQISEFYKGKYNEALIEKTLPLVIERMKTLKEYESLAGFFFKRPESYEKPVSDEHKKLLHRILSAVEWTHDEMEKTIRSAAEKAAIKPKDLFMSLRILITGKTVGPPLLGSMEILGKEETIKRLSI